MLPGKTQRPEEVLAEGKRHEKIMDEGHGEYQLQP